MSRLDVVIFGATGFTGQKAVEEQARLAVKYGLTWAVAGRSESKLQKILVDLSNKTGKDYSSMKTIIADVSDEPSLEAMCRQARVVVNCCGPYRLYGEPVVRAAIEAGTHHVDVSGEPEFIETVQLKYDAKAREAGVYIISACGFDSIPNDMGVMFLDKNFNGVLNSVESYISCSVAPEYRQEANRTGVGHYGTWESLVYGIQNYSALGPLRKQLFPNRLPAFKPTLKSRGSIHKKDDAWCVPFLGADKSIVYRTQRHLYETEQKRPIQFKPYIKISSSWLGFPITVLTIIAGAFIFIMGKFSFTRQLLLDYPKFFSFGVITKEGPSDVVMNNTTFKIELYGEGWPSQRGADLDKPNKRLVAQVSGVNPGYGATVTMLIMSAITILKEQDKMPASGGVLTTGVAFRNTNIINSLNENNVKFEIIGEKQ